MVSLNPDFNFCISFALSSDVKVTTETYNLVSVNAKVISLFASEMTHSAGRLRIRLISQLIKGITRFLQKFLQVF